MDIRNVGTPAVSKTDVRNEQGKEGSVATAARVPGIDDDKVELSALGTEWRGKVRMLDEEIRSYQDRISRVHLSQEGLVEMQTELLDYSGGNFISIRDRVNGLAGGTLYNGEPVLSAFALQSEDQIYAFSARVEVEKNRLTEERNDLTRELKTRVLSRENIILTGTQSSAVPPEAFIEEIRSYARELDRTSLLDHTRIKDLLS